MVNDIELQYELILSKGKGLLTKKAEKMMIEIGKKTMIMKKSQFSSTQDREDAHICALYFIFKNWNGYDRKYKAYPYFCEIYKRGLAHYITKESGYHKKKNTISLDNMSFNDDNY